MPPDRDRPVAVRQRAGWRSVGTGEGRGLQRVDLHVGPPARRLDRGPARQRQEIGPDVAHHSGGVVVAQHDDVHVVLEVAAHVDVEARAATLEAVDAVGREQRAPGRGADRVVPVHGAQEAMEVARRRDQRPAAGLGRHLLEGRHDQRSSLLRAHGVAVRPPAHHHRVGLVPRVAEPERIEHRLPQVVLVGPAGRLLDDVRQQRVVPVAIAPLRAGRERERLAGDAPNQAVQRVGPTRFLVVGDAVQVRDPGPVGAQHLERDRVALGELRDVARQRIREIELLFLDQPPQRHFGERLAQGRDAEHLCRRVPHAELHVREAVAFLENDALAARDQHHALEQIESDERLHVAVDRSLQRAIVGRRGRGGSSRRHRQHRGHDGEGQRATHPPRVCGQVRLSPSPPRTAHARARSRMGLPGPAPRRRARRARRASRRAGSSAAT